MHLAYGSSKDLSRIPTSSRATGSQKEYGFKISREYVLNGSPLRLVYLRFSELFCQCAFQLLARPITFNILKLLYIQLFRLAGRAINYDATITKMPCHHDPSTARAPITLSTGDSTGPQARFVMPVNFSQGWRLDRLLETTKWILLQNRI